MYIYWCSIRYSLNKDLVVQFWCSVNFSNSLWCTLGVVLCEQRFIGVVLVDVYFL